MNGVELDIDSNNFTPVTILENGFALNGNDNFDPYFLMIAELALYTGSTAERAAAVGDALMAKYAIG